VDPIAVNLPRKKALREESELMKILKLTIMLLFTAAFVFPLFYNRVVQSQSKSDQQIARSDDIVRRQRFTPNGVLEEERGPASVGQVPTPSVAEAPTGFQNRSNGFSDQGPAFETLDEDNVVAGRSFNDNRFIFEETETTTDGLGPTYNAQSCRECHQNVVTGGASQIAEHRTGHVTNGQFFESLGGSLIHSRATYPDIVEHVVVEDNIRTFRLSTNTLGNGFVEAIANDTLLSIRDSQPAALRGVAMIVPIFEGDGNSRIGRFGWKSQHASLESFSADAYLNEMGITSPALPVENTSSGVFVGFGTAYDPTPEPEDEGEDVEAFADFMRATEAPPRGPITPDVVNGERAFRSVGCAVCHVPSITTAPPGTIINAGAMTVPPALGNKVIHPFSDFLVHDIGTGDGIPFLPTSDFAFSANKIRTAPLWGLRTRNRLMHDGLSFTLQDAILRHGGQAAGVRNSYNNLSAAAKRALIAFFEFAIAR
jgi:CxxC motif-containing protein (DUF1111 family)